MKSVRDLIFGHRMSIGLRPHSWATIKRSPTVGEGFMPALIGIQRMALWLCVCCALLSALAFATTYPKLTLETQLERAEVIVRATIKEVVRVDRNKRPWTVYTLQTQQFWRGEGLLPKTSDQPSFAIFGSDKIKLEGAPSFRVGEEWIFLLYTKNYDSPIVGFNQGAYRFDGTAVLDVNGKPVQLEGKPATRVSFIAALEKILGVVR
jgi:hypothetical protein